MNEIFSEFLLDAGYILEHGIYINPARLINNEVFQKSYLDVREKEGWLCDIASIRQLPDVPENASHAEEWKIRKRSMEKLASYLSAKKNNLRVLEIGCGNGWLTHCLAQKMPDNHFTGTDVNLVELELAAEAFKEAENIAWVYAEITGEAILPENYFDVIFFAASVHYFSDLKLLMEAISRNLAPQGEIHILDTRFYTEKQAIAAKQRTTDYYAGTVPEMAKYYFHHTFGKLYQTGFKVKKMNRTAPLAILRKLDKKGWWDFFGWYCLKL